MRNHSYFSVTILALLLFTLFIPISLAQVKPLAGDDCKKLGIDCPQDGAPGIRKFILRLINIGLSFVGIIAVIVLIYAGLKYILARGDEKELEKAKSIIIYTIIGLVVIGVSAAMVNFIIDSFEEKPGVAKPAPPGGAPPGKPKGPGGQPKPIP